MLVLSCRALNFLCDPGSVITITKHWLHKVKIDWTKNDFFCSNEKELQQELLSQRNNFLKTEKIASLRKLQFFLFSLNLSHHGNCTVYANSFYSVLFSNGPHQANLVLIAYASSEGSGEPAHPRSLARTSAARSYKH